MRTVRLYGPLADFLGRSEIEADVATPAEAVRMLVANWPAVEGHMAMHQYQVLCGDYEVPVETDPHQLHYPAGEMEDIRIVPVIAGAGGNGGIFQAIAGIALIGLSFVVPFAAPVLLGLGASLALGGVAQMLTPTPQLLTGGQDDTDPRRSYSFSGIQNTARQGVPVPVCYGRVLIGSIMISQGINTDNAD